MARGEMLKRVQHDINSLSKFNGEKSMHDVKSVNKLNKVNEFNIMIMSKNIQKIRSTSHNGNAADICFTD